MWFLTPTEFASESRFFVAVLVRMTFVDNYWLPLFDTRSLWGIG